MSLPLLCSARGKLLVSPQLSPARSCQRVLSSGESLCVSRFARCLVSSIETSLALLTAPDHQDDWLGPLDGGGHRCRTSRTQHATCRFAGRAVHRPPIRRPPTHCADFIEVRNESATASFHGSREKQLCGARGIYQQCKCHR